MCLNIFRISTDKNISKLVIEAPNESEKNTIKKHVFKTIKVKKDKVTN